MGDNWVLGSTVNEAVQRGGRREQWSDSEKQEEEMLITSRSLFILTQPSEVGIAVLIPMRRPKLWERKAKATV